MRFSRPYSAYAGIYDRIGQRAFGERMAGVILNELTRMSLQPRTVLDLGCGTGSATIAFAHAGLQATGLDRSRDMLLRANEIAEKASIPVEFIEGNMIDLALPNRFDLVTCIYDTINYLENSDDVRLFFEAAHRTLASDGVFAFDMNTRQRLSSSWEHGLMLAGDSDDLYVTYRSWFDEAQDASPLVVTGFTRTSDMCWTRFDEEHIERSWPIEDVATWLEQAGFRIRLMVGYDDLTGNLLHPAKANHGRVLFMAAR